MKWSQFILTFEIDNQIILFNTYNKATVLFKIGEYNNIVDYFNKKEDYLKVNKEYLDILINLEFVIENDYDEEVNLYKDISNYMKKTEKLTVVILTTTSCNFKCSYCYENGISRNNSFKISNIKNILSLLKRYIANRKVNEIELTLFGGEPTLNWNFTKEFFIKFKEMCEYEEIKFKTDIITNGYLLDDKKINMLLENNLKRVQITLDGVAEVHNNRRVLFNGEKTFDKIIKNIEYLLSTDIEEVNIRINYDKKNADGVVELLIYISERFNNLKEKIKLSFGLVDTNLVNNNKVDLISTDQLEKYYLIFYKKAMELGFRIEKYFETGSLCMAKRINSVIISPDSKLYKCLSLIGTKLGEVGELGSDILELNNYLNLEIYRDCFQRKCEFIPMCHMGCKFKSLINKGRIDEIDCEYSALKRINTEIIKTLYDL